MKNESIIVPNLPRKENLDADSFLDAKVDLACARSAGRHRRLASMNTDVTIIFSGDVWNRFRLA